MIFDLIYTEQFPQSLLQYTGTAWRITRDSNSTPKCCFQAHSQTQSFLIKIWNRKELAHTFFMYLEWNPKTRRGRQNPPHLWWFQNAADAYSSLVYVLGTPCSQRGKGWTVFKTICSLYIPDLNHDWATWRSLLNVLQNKGKYFETFQLLYNLWNYRIIES